MAAASPKEQFEAAVKLIQSLPKNGWAHISLHDGLTQCLFFDIKNLASTMIGSFQPSNEMMLKFYAYYKQATEGPCSKPRPSFWDVINKYKWEAWNNLGSMPEEEAMRLYVEELKKIIEAMPHTEMVADFVEKLGSFYEVVDEKMPPGLMNGRALAGKMKEKARSGEPSANGNSGTGDDEGIAEQGLAQEKDKDLGPDGEDYSAIQSNLDNHTVIKSVQAQISNSVTLIEVPVQIAVKSKPRGRSPSPNPPASVSSSPSPPHNGLNGRERLDSGEESEGDEFCDTSDIPDQVPELVPSVDRISGSSSSDLNTSSLSSVDHTHIEELVTKDENSHDQVDHSLHTTDTINGVDTPDARPDHSDYSYQHRDMKEVREADVLMARGGGDVAPGGQGGAVNRGRTVASASSHRGNLPVYSGQAPSSSLSASGGSGGGHQNPRPSTPMQGEVSEQIALALLRLQQDMNSVLSRLNTLEALTVAQGQSRHENTEKGVKKEKGGWWLFPKMPGRTVAFIIIWPFVVHWLLAFFRRKRSR